MTGKRREQGDYISIDKIATQIGSSRSTIIRSINQAEVSDEPPVPSLNMQGKLLHKDEVSRVSEIVAKYKQPNNKTNLK